MKKIKPEKEFIEMLRDILPANITVSHSWQSVDSDLKIEGWGCLSVCDNDVYGFYDYKIISKHTPTTLRFLRRILKANKVKAKLQNWDSFVRIWLYW